MSFLHTIPPEEAVDEVRDLYDQDLQGKGYIANYSRVFSLRPEVLGIWRQLQHAIRRNMRLRRDELTTLAAALAMKCSY